MQAQTIYQDIAKRTGGDIYIGDAVIIRLKIDHRQTSASLNKICGRFV